MLTSAADNYYSCNKLKTGVISSKVYPLLLTEHLDQNKKSVDVWKWLISSNCWHKSRILKWNNYSYTCVWIVVLTPKWRTMPKGIWNGRCFLTLITPALQEHVKHEHISHFCSTNSNKDLHYSRGILTHSWGLICPRAAPMGDISTPWLITPARQSLDSQPLAQ